MPITAKPFSIAEKIVKRIFAGSPSIYSKEDVNQMADVDEYAFYAMNNNLGYTTTGFVPTTPTFIQTATQLEFEIDYTGGGKLFAKKTVFDIPAFNYDRTGGSKITISTRTAGVRNFWLVAKRNVITFSDDNVMSGVNGSGFPAPLPSSDAVTYSDERVEMTSGVDTAPTLGTDEEAIAILCQIAFKEDTTNLVTGGSNAYLQINCPDITTLLGKVFPSPNVASKTQGVIPNLMKLADYLSNSFIKKGWTDVSGSIVLNPTLVSTNGLAGTVEVKEHHSGLVHVTFALSITSTIASGSLTAIFTGLPAGHASSIYVPTNLDPGTSVLSMVHTRYLCIVGAGLFVYSTLTRTSGTATFDGSFMYQRNK